MTNILKMTWKDNNSGKIIELLENCGLVKGRKLGRWVKRGYLDGLLTQYAEDKKMEEMAYWIDPCKEIDILIKFGYGFHVAFVLVKGKENSPSIDKFLYSDYIYIYTCEDEDRTCMFKLEDAKIINEEIQKYYNAVQEKLMGLNSKLKGYDLYCTNSLQILHKNITNGQVINFFDQQILMNNLTKTIKYINGKGLRSERRKECMLSKQALLDTDENEENT
jgi:hypothetical protein